MNLIPLAFPPQRDQVRAQWAPVFLEPILGSGERLTVAIIVVANGQIAVERAPRLNRLSCLYGSAASDLSIAIDLTVQLLQQFARTAGLQILDGTVSPLHNISIGRARNMSGATIAEVIETAFSASSSFTLWPEERGQLVEDNDIYEEINDTEIFSISASNRQLLNKVMMHVITSDPNLGRCFRYKWRVSKEGRKQAIDFVGSRLIANVRMLLPGQRLNTSFERVKAGLYDLEVFRRAQVIAAANEYRLLLHVPTQGTQPDMSDLQARRLTEAADELQSQALQERLALRTVNSTDEIVTEILRLEAG
jgi:hypothetical protein